MKVLVIGMNGGGLTESKDAPGVGEGKDRKEGAFYDQAPL